MKLYKHKKNSPTTSDYQDKEVSPRKHKFFRKKNLLKFELSIRQSIYNNNFFSTFDLSIVKANYPINQCFHHFPTINFFKSTQKTKSKFRETILYLKIKLHLFVLLVHILNFFHGVAINFNILK